MLSSILAPDHLASLVVERYNMAPSSSCRLLKTGINHSYQVTASGQHYLLRVYFKGWKTELEISEELRVLNLLKDKEVSVSFPIKDIDEKYIQQVHAPEGVRYVVLFSFAKGTSIKVPSEELCFSLGNLLAKTHQSTLDLKVNRKNYNAHTLVEWAFAKAQTFFVPDSPEMDYYRKITERIAREFNNAEKEALRSGVVHLDVWYENMKVDDDQKITLFDFDNCGNGWLFLDIGYCAMLLFRNETDKAQYPSKLNKLLAGYESICAISAEEKRLLPYAGAAIWLHYNGIHVQRFNDFSNPFLSEDFLKYWIQTVKDWMAFNRIYI